MRGTKQLAFGLLLGVALILVSAQTAKLSTLYNLKAMLERNLPEKVSRARIHSPDDRKFRDFLAQKIESDLARVNTSGLIPVIGSVSVSVLAIQQQSYRQARADDRVTVFWTEDGERQYLSLGVSYVYNGFALIIPSFLLAGLCLWAIRRLPNPLSGTQQALSQRLVEGGCGSREASRRVKALGAVSQSQLALFDRLREQENMGAAKIIGVLSEARRARLDHSSLAWLIQGLSIYHGDVAKALAAATANATLELRISENTVVCHGVSIPLAGTPFFYYYWYALRRHKGIADGWFTNPPSNRSDFTAAGELLALMEKYDGNGRAVRELRENGLRSKILDQNRSKIKDEIIAVLGERLAVDYLFEQARDPARARNRYRLAIPPQRISFTP